MSDHLSGMPWFLREHIHNSRWTSFRDVQVRTFDTFSSCDDHILVASGTSSGKTEAALFPVITSLYNHPSEGIGALYIGPLKALIDDQFQRLEPILRESGVAITGWHGDIGQGIRERVLGDPQGILQITPESLENILSDRPEEVPRLFGGLRFVVVDEVHAFMDSERGLQLLCCLQRMEVMARCDPRRIGLSATVPDTEAAAAWLSADTGRRTTVVTDASPRGQGVTIRHNHFPAPDPEGDDTERKRAITRYYKGLYSEVAGRDSIVFVNSRSDAETVGRSLRKVAERYHGTEDIHVHHGSISREFRKAAEDSVRDPSRKTTVVATVTLELGMDIGGLDRVVQIEAPLTCSGLVQRLGRSGRRGGDRSMTIMCNEDESDPWSTVQGVDMSLVKAVAMTELAVGEGWTEPPSVPSLPYGLLYHQTMEYLKSGTGARFGRLVSDVLSLYPFRDVDEDDYRTLLRHMVAEGQLERMSDGTLLIGDRGERTVFDRDFCSVFRVRREIDVVNGDRTIGSIQEMPEVGETVQLAGHVWEVVRTRPSDNTVEVVESDGSAFTPWRSGTPGTHTLVMRRMRDVLESDTEYPYLDTAASNRLRICRAFARGNGMLETFAPTERGFRIHPWLGTVQFDTLRRAVRDVDGVDSVYGFQPYLIDVTTDLSLEELLRGVDHRLSRGGDTDLVRDNDRIRLGKYDRFVPDTLLRKAFVRDRLDFDFDLLDL
ncbi:MAG: DEAD/DEAH box helicase [Candidatus Methanomethylophilaceae archaeon]|nr:DEAD/DEAH box helicase [Candidatus Methanomethylophilaceae archaeon]